MVSLHTGLHSLTLHGLHQERLLTYLRAAVSHPSSSPLPPPHSSSVYRSLACTLTPLQSTLNTIAKVVVQSLSCVQLFVTPWTAEQTEHARLLCPPLSPAVYSYLRPESVMLCNHLILCHPLPLLLSVSPSIRVFSNESVLRVRWPKYWSFSFNISPSNDHSRLISFRMDWLDLLAIQGTLKSLLQQHSSKAPNFWCSAFLMVQLSHPYMTTGKTIALTIRTFVGKVTSLLFNTLSRFVLAFLPRSRCLNFTAAATVLSDFEPQENKVCHCFHSFPPSICQEVMGPDAKIFAFGLLSFKPVFSLLSFTVTNSLFSSSSFSFITMIRTLLNFKM